MRQPGYMLRFGLPAILFQRVLRVLRSSQISHAVEARECSQMAAVHSVV